MLKWSGLLVRLGGRRQPHFSEEFFSQLDQEILVVDDYRYVRIDFRNDPDLVLPEGYDWDASLGKKNMLDLFSQQLCFYAFRHFYMFLVFDRIFFVLYKSCAEAADENVSTHTEGCYTLSCGPKRHHW